MDHVRIDKEQYKQLKEIKQRTGVPIAETVRRAIDEYLEKRKQGVK